MTDTLERREALLRDIDRELEGPPGSADNRRQMLKRARDLLALTPSPRAEITWEAFGEAVQARFNAGTALPGDEHWFTPSPRIVDEGRADCECNAGCDPRPQEHSPHCPRFATNPPADLPDKDHP